ncbi:O-glucosyltransferase rumi homolog [Chenopodium quinoa]|uniref:O-glucosyltransferase rumi homolog n=1 Tax=Chenopodium quinoa TaxID=63459 RepID=UPI000B78BCDE|nr:O-glucosyltransferase rumi homolog [Chenopodium quinoa]
MAVGKIDMAWFTVNKKKILFYFYIFLFLGCILLVRRFDHTVPSIKITNYSKSPDSSNKNIPTSVGNTPKNAIHSSKATTEYPIICPTTSTNQTCLKTNYPTTIEVNEANIISSSIDSCPNYFRWIHEDLRPWVSKGITKESLEAGKNVASFRLIILEGRVFLQRYKRIYETRDMFTIWGILQLLRLYPGKLPDLDLMFESGDKPVIKKSDYHEAAANYTSPVPPMFHYFGDDQHFDIPFPDWSFWGWQEKNIKPWGTQLNDIIEGNQKVKWVNRVPYAYWKGNSLTGNRRDLLRCNSTRASKAQIYDQSSPEEVNHGFKQSNMAAQCTHRYKIYMEGKAWSTSGKYIQACDSMLLLVQPQYYEFYTRSLLPLKQYWPINPSKLCESIKFAVVWGNKHPNKAQEIAKGGSKFITEELNMKYIYDYMFHLLNEYGKLMKYKPTIPPNAVEVCTETMACKTSLKDKEWKLNSLVKAPSQTSPCSIPPAYDPHHLQTFLKTKEEILRDVEGLSRVG